MKSSISSPYNTKSYKLSNNGELLNDLLGIKTAGCADDCNIIINGNACTVDAAIQLVNVELDKIIAKKNITHKRVQIAMGASGWIAGSRHSVWVKR
jgi:hypothetical protein